MESIKKCLLIYPGGKQELVHKSTHCIDGQMSELEKHIDSLNTASKIGRSMRSSVGVKITNYTLVYYSGNQHTNLANVINIKDNANYCICGATPVHDFHGVVGIAKYKNGIQVDYENGDLENSISYKYNDCKIILITIFIFYFLLLLWFNKN